MSSRKQQPVIRGPWVTQCLSGDVSRLPYAATRHEHFQTVLDRLAVLRQLVDAHDKQECPPICYVQGSFQGQTGYIR